MATLQDMMNQLLEDMELYGNTLKFTDSHFAIGIELTDTSESVTMVIDDKVTIEGGLQNPVVKLKFSRDLLEKAMRGKADLFALGGRSHIDDKKPVDFEFLDKSRMKESMEALYRIAIYFFVPGRIKSRKMKLELTGSVHGAKPIPLVYWDDLRTAWYHVPAGSTLNEAGKKDLYPQAFIVLKGKGRLELEGSEVEIVPQTTYYIPRESTHKVRADEDVKLIWLAWKAPMFG
jgi:mannose-6-phosphate isomerase-like protein (cupin superfamily)